MPRVHVLPLGALDAFDAQTRWYAVSVDGGRPRALQAHEGDAVAMAAIAQIHAGAQLTCAPELAAAAPDYRPEAWTDDHLRQAAVLAVRHALALPYLAVADDLAIARLIEGAAALAAAHVEDAVVRATFSQRGATSLFHATITGTLLLDAGPTPAELALSVFATDRDLDAYLAAVADADADADAPGPHLATLHLLAGAPGLQEAMVRYTGQPFAPSPLIHAPQPEPLEDHDVRWLASLAFAASDLLEHRDRTEVEAVYGDAQLELGTRLTVAAP